MVPANDEPPAPVARRADGEIDPRDAADGGERVHLFVSYSRRDARLVEQLVDLLRTTRRKVFRDADSLTPGRRWADELAESIDQAEDVLVFWCAHSARSDYVRAEVERALETGTKHVIPVRLDSTALSTELSPIQAIDLRDAVARDHRATPWRRRLARALALAASLTLLTIGWVACIEPEIRTTHFVTDQIGRLDASLQLRMPDQRIPPHAREEWRHEAITMGIMSRSGIEIEPTPLRDGIVPAWNGFLADFRRWVGVPDYGETEIRLRPRNRRLDSIHAKLDGIDGISCTIDSAEGVVDCATRYPAVLAYSLTNPPVQTGLDCYDDFALSQGSQLEALTNLGECLWQDAFHSPEATQTTLIRLLLWILPPILITTVLITHTRDNRRLHHLATTLHQQLQNHPPTP